MALQGEMDKNNSQGIFYFFLTEGQQQMWKEGLWDGCETGFDVRVRDRTSVENTGG